MSIVFAMRVYFFSKSTSTRELPLRILQYSSCNLYQGRIYYLGIFRQGVEGLARGLGIFLRSSLSAAARHLDRMRSSTSSIYLRRGDSAVGELFLEFT